MGTVTYTYTVDGTEGKPAQYFYEPLVTFTGHYVVVFTCPPPYPQTWNLFMGFATAPGSPCTLWSPSPVGSDTTRTVDGYVSDLGCTWEALFFGVYDASDIPPGGTVFVITVTADDIVTPGTVAIPSAFVTILG